MPIEYKKEGPVAIFTINHPGGTNLLNREDLRELGSVMIDFRDNPDLRVGIITGNGRRVFCAGFDLKDMPTQAQSNPRDLETVTPLPQRGLDIWKPLIAAINGLAIGGGLEIALACDIRIASSNARFGMPEVTLGLIPGWGGTQRLPRQIPWCKAAEMILTGKLIDAQEAYRLNLVNEIAPNGNLMPTARNYAEAICQASPTAVRAAKEAMQRGYGMTLEEGLKLENVLLSQVLQTKDYTEGMKAFTEHRKPVFRGY